MNAVARFKFDGTEKLQAIGSETLRLQAASLTHSFDPRLELRRLLSSPPIYDAHELEEAEAAAARLAGGAMTDIDGWAKALGSDLGQFRD